jgi:cyclophilin family peptidyl-prolyl cis-trans isomerase
MLAKLIRGFGCLLTIALAACGGGSPAPYVADIQANQLAYAQTTQFSVTGSSLNLGLNVSAKGCSSFTPTGVTTSSGLTWNCVVDAVGTAAVIVQVSTATGEVLLSKSFDIPAPTTPVVLSIKEVNLMYSKTAQFTMTGYSLDKDFSVSTQNCKGLALVSGGSSTSKSVTCKVGAAGVAALKIEAKLADGTSLILRSFDVPNPQVTMATNLGTLAFELNPTAAPLSTDNFLQYVNDKFYDNTLIHRIVTNGIFVAQGGWLTPAPTVQTGQRAAIALEVGKGLSNVKGTIAMARAADLNSANSQFFFNLSDNTALDTANGGYAVFGQVVSGQAVLDALAKTPTSTQYGLNDFPNQNVVVQSVVQSK